MAPRRSNRGGRILPKIQNLRWSGGSNVFSALSAGSVAATMISGAATTDTIMRMRGELMAYVDTTQAPGGHVRIAVGAIVMPEGQGTTVVSSPITDDLAPWWFYETFALGYEEMVTDVIDVPGITSFRKTIDVKGMRILRPDQEMQIVVENLTIVSALSINVSIVDRILIGEH